jgi:hypothetical protein
MCGVGDRSDGGCSVRLGRVDAEAPSRSLDAASSPVGERGERACGSVRRPRPCQRRRRPVLSVIVQGVDTTLEEAVAQVREEALGGSACPSALVRACGSFRTLVPRPPVSRLPGRPAHPERLAGPVGHGPWREELSEGKRECSWSRRGPVTAMREVNLTRLTEEVAAITLQSTSAQRQWLPWGRVPWVGCSSGWYSRLLRRG